MSLERAAAAPRPDPAGQGPPGAPGLRPLRESEFRLFHDLIYRETGIHLASHKQPLLAGRLARRLRELGLRRFAEYYRLVRADPAEQVLMIDLICTHETRFFREPRHFELLERVLLPAWVAAADRGQRPRHLRAWSAGCSTGEEPFSLAMCLLAACPPSAGWRVEVLATDLSTRAVERAAGATWPIARAREIPEPLLKRFLLRGVGAQQGWMRAAPELRAIVRVARLNLNDPVWPVGGPFDLIFCRNVLIYFDGASRARAAARLLDHLTPPDGHLFLGHSESLLGSAAPVRCVFPTVYTRAGTTPRG